MSFNINYQFRKSGFCHSSYLIDNFYYKSVRHTKSLLELNIKTNLISATIFNYKQKVTQTDFILYPKMLIIQILEHIALFDTEGQLLNVGLGHER